MKPRPSAQREPSVLCICPGVDGFRLAFVNNRHFDHIATFRTFDEAGEAQKAAREALALINPERTV